MIITKLLTMKLPTLCRHDKQISGKKNDAAKGGALLLTIAGYSSVMKLANTYHMHIK